jgi:hypothetical protein
VNKGSRINVNFVGFLERAMGIEHARSGSDRWTASNSPLINSTSPFPTVAMLPSRPFHKVSRASWP